MKKDEIICIVLCCIMYYLYCVMCIALITQTEEEPLKAKQTGQIKKDQTYV